MSTLPPPPLEAAGSGTRTMQRFDVGRARQKKQEERMPSSVEILVSTVKMTVPESVRNLPVAEAAEEWVPRTVTMPIPPSLPLTDSYALPRAARVALPRGIVDVRQVAWALAASFSLVGLGAIVCVPIVFLLFP